MTGCPVFFPAGWRGCRGGHGVAQAATSLGTTRPKIVAFDAEPAEVQLLQEGKVDALIAQQPVKMGQVAAHALLDAVAGKTVKPVTIPTVLITKDTLAQSQAYIYHS